MQSPLTDGGYSTARAMATPCGSAGLARAVEVADPPIVAGDLGSAGPGAGVLG